MQPTGQSRAEACSAAPPVATLRNPGLCGSGPEGLQLMRNSLAGKREV